MLMMMIQTKRKVTKGNVAARSANVDDDVDDEPNDPDNPSLNSVAQDDEATEDEREPWIDYMMRATHKADDSTTAIGTKPRISKQSGAYWKQAR